MNKSLKVPSLVHAKLAQNGEYQTKPPQVPSSILTEGSIWLRFFFLISRRKASDVNIRVFP